MHDARSRPCGGQEHHGRIFEGAAAEKLRKAQIVTDGDGALHAVELKDGGMIALAEEAIFLRRREKMRFVVIGNERAVTAKDVAAVRRPLPVADGHGAADDMNAAAFRQRGKQRFRPLAARVQIVLQRAREKADVPKLGQYDDVGRVLHGGVQHATKRRLVFITVANSDGHLQNGNFHLVHLGTRIP